MSTDQSITISGHVDSTIYYREGREWITLDGREYGAYEYRPGSSVSAIKVVKRNDSYFTVQGVPTTGLYSGSEIMERISHDISTFWTKLASVLDSVRSVPEIDTQQLLSLFDIMVGLAHQCGSEIEKERANSRTFLLESESLNLECNLKSQELIACYSKINALEAKSKGYSKALKCALRPSKDDPPLLHHLCRYKEVPVAEIAQECGLDIHQPADFPFLEHFSDLPVETTFLPIHVAALSGNASAMKGLYELDNSVAEEVTGKMKMSVLEVSAFASLECFELSKGWLKPSKSIPSADKLLDNRSCILTMAAIGGNSELLSSVVPSPQLFSVVQFPEFWEKLILCALVRGDLASLDWLMSFSGATDFLTENLCMTFLFSEHSKHIKLECVQWMVSHGLTPQRLFAERSSNNMFQHEMAESGRVDILEWLSTLPGFQMTARGSDGYTLMHAACQSNFVSVLDWVFEHPSSKQDDFNLLTNDNDHLVHVSALHGSLECLQWIHDKIIKFQRNVDGSRYLLSLTGLKNRTVVHRAALRGDIKTLAWLLDVHGTDFSKYDLKDTEGQFPIHFAFKNVDALEWLVDVGKCDLKSRDNHGRQVLHKAISVGEYDVVCYIVSKLGHSCLNSATPGLQKYPIHFANSDTMTKYLISLGSDSASQPKPYFRLSSPNKPM